jgi:hypothetical protein
MGLKPIEFYSVSPKEFWLMAEGFRAKRLDEYKLNRNIMYIMVKLWSSKPVNSPKELWDLGDEDTKMTDDEAKMLAEHFAKLNAKNG